MVIQSANLAEFAKVVRERASQAYTTLILTAARLALQYGREEEAGYFEVVSLEQSPGCQVHAFRALALILIELSEARHYISLSQ